MHERNKLAFWILVCAALVIICVPSTILLGDFQRYEQFLAGFEPPLLRPSRTRSMPHDSDRAGAVAEPKFEFVDFQLRDSKAKKVCLVGDFNHWKPETLFLAKLSDQSWELTLPLPSGRYRYRFWVDGVERVDPGNKTLPETDPVGNQPASVKVVKLTRAWIAMAVLSLGLALPARAFFGRENAKITVLWVPSESFSDWNELDSLLERCKDAKFTIALAPEKIPADAARQLASWNAAGRLELALRLEGDPILPLIADHPDAPRPQDALDRLALARESFKNRFGIPPSGFAPGAGALSPPLLEAFNAMALPWVAAGDYAGSSDTWAAMGKTVLVPFKAVQTMGADLSPADLSLPDYPHPDVFVIDEADGLVPEGAWLRLLKLLGDKRPRADWQTVTESIALRSPAGWADAYSVKKWPSWAGSTASWTSGRAAQQAWKLYGEAARALEHYQNSGIAQLKTLEDATNELYQAQSSGYYRLLASPQDSRAQAADRDLRSHLLAVYRKTKQTPPEALFLSLLGESAAKSPEGDNDQADAGSSDIHFTQGDSWLSFENPPGSASRAPEGAPPLADGTQAAQLWNIKSLRIDWNTAAITFVYRMARLDNSLEAPAEMGPLLIDTYIDINHIVGAGSIEMLPGRPGAVVTRDAWEYALTVSGWGAFLYRSNPLGSPILSGKLAVTADLPSGEVRVVVPRSMLRGNPLRWGYIVAAFATDTESTSKPPPKPAVDGKRGGILGLLAPLEQQMSLAAESSRPRLTAIRAKTE